MESSVKELKGRERWGHAGIFVDEVRRWLGIADRGDVPRVVEKAEGNDGNVKICWMSSTWLR